MNDRGLGVVIAVQNEQAANPHGWKFGWTVRSTNFVVRGGIGPIASNEAFQFVTIQDSDPFVGLSHPYYYSATNAPDRVMLPGKYLFSWRFDMGPWCEFNDKYSALYVFQSEQFPVSACFSSCRTEGVPMGIKTDYSSISQLPSRKLLTPDVGRSLGKVISRGSFTIEVADDAPFPEVAGTCGSVAGAVNIVSTTTSRHYDRVQRTTSTNTCAMTASVTDALDVCRATLQPTHAASISQFMTWVSGAKATGAATSGGIPQPALLARAWLCILVLGSIAFLW